MRRKPCVQSSCLFVIAILCGELVVFSCCVESSICTIVLIFTWILFIDLGDELLSDSFPYKEIQNGVLWEVDGKVSDSVSVT